MQIVDEWVEIHVDGESDPMLVNVGWRTIPNLTRQQQFALCVHGYTDVASLQDASDSELLSIHGIDGAALRHIRRALSMTPEVETWVNRP